MTPLLVARRSQRRFSMARMRAMLRCCQGALVSPYQPSSLMLTRTSAPSCGEVADLVGKDGLVADEDAVAMAVEAEGGCGRSPREKRRDLAGEFVGEGQVLLEGDVFAEGDEVDLVVAADAVAVGGEDHGGVVVEPLLLIL